MPTYMGMGIGMGMSLHVAFVCIALAGVLPWTEAHSSWEGTWKLSIGTVSFDKIVNCRSVGQVARELKVTLECPDIATDEFGNKGYWSTISDYALEIVLQGRKFFYYPRRRRETNSTQSNHSSSNDDQSRDLIPPGWSHDLLGNNWACFSGIRPFPNGKPQPESARDTPSKPLQFKKRAASSGRSGSELFRTDHELISAINQGQSFWTAKRYPEFENMTIDEMTNMAGGKDSLLFLGHGEASAATEEQRNATALLPKNWDWRSVNGKNFVSPVRHQGNCGSCYAFAVTAVIESRVRVLTNNKVAPIYSPQDIVDCSAYSSGCNGGNMFAVGKYGEDYGYAEESCSPYKAAEKTCKSVAKCKRSYAVDYEIIGSRSGGCNDLAMQLAIYYGGPIGVGYTVYTDFRYYESGIYYHYGPNNVRGGHAVTAVGWGEDERTGTKYWIVKNSWGSNWGENGYFRIIRGLNECGFEGRAFQTSPIL